MRKALFATLVVAIVATAIETASAQPKIPFKSRELQEGRSFVQRLVAVPTSGGATGSLDYSFAFELPPGRNVTPQLALQYSSSGPMSYYGKGWELTVPMIERSSRHGVPRLDGSDTFQYREGHGVRPLVKTGTKTSDGWDEYREERESSFRRYLFDGARWRILDPNGLRYELGNDAKTQRVAQASGSSVVVTWMVYRIIDTHSNYAEYVYQAGPDGHNRLRSIYYTGNLDLGTAPRMAVDLIWQNHRGTAPSPRSNRNGISQVFGRDRLAQVITYAARQEAAAPTTVPLSSPTARIYELGHGNAVSTMDDTFRVTRIAEQGLPAVELLYEDPFSDGQIHQQGTMGGFGGSYALPQHLGAAETELEENALSWTRSTFADVTGDGLPDLVDAETQCGSGYWTIWRNDGDSFDREIWPVPTPFVSGFDDCALRVTRQDGDATRTIQELVDLNGDGKADLAFFDTAEMWMCPGNGAGYDACEPWGTMPGGLAGALRREWAVSGHPIGYTDADLVDFDGDGLPDRVSLRMENNGAATLIVVRNDRGLGWGVVTEVPFPAYQLPGVTACLRAHEHFPTQDGTPYNRRLLAEYRDLNGDGLPDFLTTSGGIYVSWGNGRGVEPAVASGLTAFGLGYQADGGAYHANTDLVDVNGDALPDLVERTSTQIRVRYNAGGVFDATPHEYTVPIPNGSYHGAALSRVVPVADYHARTEVKSMFTDINGDGLPDFISAPLGPQAFPGNFWVARADYRAPRLLSQVWSFGAMHSATIRYAARPWPDIPFPIHASVEVTRRRSALYAGEPLAQTELVTTHDYDGPVFDPVDRELRGFRRVITIDGDQRARTTIYRVGKYDSGTPEMVTVENLSAESSARSELSSYSEVPLPGGAVWLRLDQRVVIDGGFPQPRVMQTTFHTHDGYGQPTSWTEEGDPSTTLDDVEHYQNYAVRDDSLFRILVPSYEYRVGAEGDLGMTLWYYDNRNAFGMPPTRGNLVKVELQQAMYQYSTTEAFYDDEFGAGHGVVTKEVDAAGATTSYAYDTTHRQFRVRSESPAGTHLTSYHALTGQAAVSCGPQYVGATWNCTTTEIDVHGREVALHGSEQLAPGGPFSSFLATRFEYDESVYPIVMRRITRPGTAEQSLTVQYRDGFGHAVQIRQQENDKEFLVHEVAYDAIGTVRRQTLDRRAQGPTYQPAPLAPAVEYAHDHVRGEIERATFPRDPGDPRPPASVARVHYGSYVLSTDEVGRTRRYDFDGFDRVVAITQDGGDLGAAVSRFTFDGNGHVRTSTDPNGLVTEYTRNYLGWVDKQITPDGAVTEFRYDSRGEVSKVFDPRGVTIDYQRDGAGRLRRIFSSGGPASVTPVSLELTYNDATNPGELGWLASESSDGIVTSYRYTPTGAVRETKVAYGGAVYKVGTVSDRTGRLSAVEYPDGRTIAYEYDLADRVKRVYEGGHDYARLDYEPGGEISVVESSDGLVESYLYDVRQRVTQILSTRAQIAGDLVNDTFVWTDASEVEWIDRGGLLPGGQPRPAPEITHIGLDPFGRLETITRDGLTVAEYLHDAGGRLQMMNEGAAYKYKYVADRMTQRTAGKRAIKYEYDAVGNAVRETTWLGAALKKTRKHGWDALGRYIGTDTDGDAWTRYFYDSQGDIVRVIGPGAGDGGDTLSFGVWGRVDRTTGEITDRIYAGARLIAEATGSDLEYVHRGLGGTIAAVTGEDGEILRQEELHAYGDIAAEYGTSDVPERYHGVRRDQLEVAGGRAYDRAAGRWLGRDRLGLEEPGRIFTNFVTLDLYGYSNGNPFRFTDETGLAPIEINAAGGHHYVPREVTAWARIAMDLSADAAEVFDKTTTGWPVHKDIPNHGWSQTHSIYNQNVLAELQHYCKVNKIDLAKMTKAQAAAFIKSLPRSPDPVISTFIAAHEEVVRDARAGKPPKEIGRRFSASGKLFRRGGRFAMKALGGGIRLFNWVGWGLEVGDAWEMFKAERDGLIPLYRTKAGWSRDPRYPDGQWKIPFPEMIYVTPAQADALESKCDPQWCA